MINDVFLGYNGVRQLARFGYLWPVDCRVLDCGRLAWDDVAYLDEWSGEIMIVLFDDSCKSSY